MSQLEIQILHQDYLLTCPDGHEAQLLEAVERVDQQFQQMRDTSKLRSRERVGVLLAVNLAYENLELRHQLQALQQQVTSLQGMDTPAHSDTDTARLLALEAQTLADQEAALRLIDRLDAVLSNAPSAHLSPSELAATHGDGVQDDTPEAADADADADADETLHGLALTSEPVHAVTTDLDSNLDMGMAQVLPENL